MKMWLHALFFALCVLPLSGQDEETPEAMPEVTLEAVQASASSDLREALDELAELRAQIAAEKPELARETNQIAADLRELRRQADLAKTDREAAESELDAVEKELDSVRQERSYIESLVLDFENSFLSTRSRAEWEENPAQGKTSWDSLTQTLAELESVSSLNVADGKALGTDGVLVEGRFVELGPITWFLSKEEEFGGLIVPDPTLRPTVLTSSANPEKIAALLAGDEVPLPFDPTLGDAIAMAETQSTLLEHIQQGGFWIIPILLLAAIALAAALAKWFQLSRIRALSAATVAQAIEKLNEKKYEEVLTESKSLRHPAGKILKRCAELVGNTPALQRDDLEEALFEIFLEAQPRLQKGLPLIAIASATAPLLGLLGTVTGMIETFRLINLFGTGDAKTLASGISEALVTTEFGLIVAIPALILHALLSRKIQGIKSQMEMTSLALLNGVQLPSGKSSS